MERERAGAIERIGLLPLLGLAALAAFVRSVYVVVAGAQRIRVIDDALWYHLQANFIAKGQWFRDPIALAYSFRSHPSAAHPPLYPLVLSAASAVGWTSVRAHELVGCVIGAGTVVVVALVANELGGRRCALIAGALACLYPPLWINDGGLMSEGLFALVIACVLFATYRFARRPGVGRGAVLGLTLGLAALTRAEAILLVPLLALPVVLLRARWHRFVVLAVVLLATAVTVAPWVGRNLATFSRPVTLSTGDGILLAGANCHDSYYGPGIGLWSARCPGRGPAGDESVVSAFRRHEAVTYARRHSLRVPVVVGVRLARVWEAYDPLANARINADDLRPEWARYLALGSYYAVLPFALVGGLVAWRRRVWLLPVVSMAVFVSMTAMLAWGSERFRVPVEVVLVICASIALDRLLGDGSRGPNERQPVTGSRTTVSGSLSSRSPT